MNRNLNTKSDEKNIRKLFDEMRQHDQQTVPTFAAVLQKSSNAETVVHTSRLLSFAAAAILILILAGAAAVIYFRQPAPQKSGLPKENKKEQVADNPPVQKRDEKAAPVPAPRRVKYRPRIRTPRRTDLLISQWQSPTDFLLRTPGNDFLRVMPKLNDPFFKMDTTRPDQPN